MIILLVEDDKQKGERLIEFLSREYPGATLEWTKSVSTGIDAIDDLQPSLLILDMSLPAFQEGRSLHSGGRQHNFGGMDILAYMKAVGFACPTIIVTQFPEFEDKGLLMGLDDLHRNLERDFTEFYVGLVHYKHSEESWISQLDRLMKKGNNESSNN
jgi:DNA-binding response OmpR family regulator